MLLHRCTKKELIDLFEDLQKENEDLLIEVENANSDKHLDAARRRVQTMEGLFNRSQQQLKVVTSVLDGTQFLLNEERRDSEILLKIQEHLIMLLDGKVWICPTCAKVAKGTSGPHLVMCAECSSPST